MHLQRFVILDHEKIRKVFEDANIEQKRKKEERAMKLYSNARDVIELNASILDYLKEKKRTKNSHTNDQDFTIEQCTMADFDLLFKNKLRAFVIVRESPNIYEGMTMDIPTVKGSLKAILNGKTHCLLQWAYDRRTISVKANSPILPVSPPNSSTVNTIPLPFTINSETPTPGFTPTIDWLQTATNSISSIARKNATSGFDLTWFSSQLLSKMLISRLESHLTCGDIPENKGLRHWVWKWQMQNLPRMSSILKLAGLVLPDKFLSSRTCHDCLLRHDAFSTTEIVSDANGYETGAYLYLFAPNNGIIQQWRRAGSAAVSFKKRGDEHVRASMQRSDEDRDSLFYRTFPNQLSKRQKTESFEGHFQDLHQRVGLSYTKCRLDTIIGLFEWNQFTEVMLGKVKVDLPIKEKKHRLICYLFETVLQLCLDTRLNVSRSYGNELFLGVIHTRNE